jgi:hypothetical protein
VSRIVLAEENLRPDVNEPVPKENIVEFSLLLSESQAKLLEATAYSKGLTTGQMLRRLVHDYFSRFAQPRPA